jgi:hypothetical protein
MLIWINSRSKVGGPNPPRPALSPPWRWALGRTYAQAGRKDEAMKLLPHRLLCGGSELLDAEIRTNDCGEVISPHSAAPEQKMKKTAAAILIMALALALPALAQSGQDREEKKPEPRYRAFNFSLFYPLGLNKSKSDSANFNLTLLYGRMGSVRGLDLALAVTDLEESIEGIQLAGLIAGVGKSVKGWQAAGLISAAGEGGQGFQTAGLGSVSGEEFQGLQAAGLFCVAGESLEGIQLSGLFSVAGNSAKGIQFSGLFGVAGNSLEGLQVSGLFNVSGEGLRGAQVAGLFNVGGEDSTAVQVAGLANITGKTCRGVQVGALNVAARLTGLQIGLVNVAGELEGVPVGLVNLTKKEDRRVSLATWAGSVSLINAGVKIWAKRFYSILFAGAANVTQEATTALAYGFQYGYGIRLRPTGGREKRIEIDAGYLYLDNRTILKRLGGTPDRHVLSLRGALAVDISRGATVFAGVGLKHMTDYGKPFSSGAVSPLVFAGVELF